MFLLTFRCHTSDPHTFELVLPILINTVQQYSNKYSWTIENDNTLERHLHMILIPVDSFKDGATLKQRLLNRKELKSFKDYLKFKSQTNLINALDIKKINENDFLNTLGYIHKEELIIRTESKNISNEEILKGIKLYLSSQKIQTLNNINKSDWKYLTPKNAHSIIEDFVEKNPDICFEEIISELLKNKISTVQMNAKQLKKVYMELKFHHTDDENLKKDISSKLNQQIHGYEINENYDTYTNFEELRNWVYHYVDIENITPHIKYILNQYHTL